MSENDYGKYTIDANGFKVDKVDTSKLLVSNLLSNSLPAGNYTFIKPPEQSEWQCYLFGNRPGSIGMIYRPNKGREPNWLARWFMRVCFDCLWVKDQSEKKI